MKIHKKKSNFFDGGDYGFPDKLLTVVYFAGVYQVSITSKRTRGIGITESFESSDDVIAFIQNNFKKDLEVEIVKE